MPVYSIGYDISEKSKSSHAEVDKAIMNNCSGYIRYADSKWIVKYSGNAKNLSDLITKTGFGNEDKLLVIKVVAEYEGWLNKEQWEIIKTFFN